MVGENVLTSGSNRYKESLNRYGKEDVIDQVRNHTICDVKGGLTPAHVIVTDKYVICTGEFVISYNDLELFDITSINTSGLQAVFAFDNRGQAYAKRLVGISSENIGKVKAAVASVIVNTKIGMTPTNYLEYKRARMSDIEARSLESDPKGAFTKFTRSKLLRNPNIKYAALFGTIGILSLFRLTESETALQTGAIILMSLIMSSVGFLPFILWRKNFARYREFVKENDEDVLDQLNNKVLFRPRTSHRCFVTEKYIVIVGSCILRREDAAWITGYIYKGHWYIDLTDKEGNKVHAGMGYSTNDWQLEQLKLADLLPNCLVFQNEANKRYYEERYKRQV